MEEYMDYEMNNYLSKEAEEYGSFSDLLKTHGVTFSMAQKSASDFKANYDALLAKYAIGHNNIVQTCYDLMNRIEQPPNNTDLQYLYLCTVTDCGLLNCADATNKMDVQAVENYFQQMEKIQTLSDFLSVQRKNSKKLQIFVFVKIPSKTDTRKEYLFFIYISYGLKHFITNFV